MQRKLNSLQICRGLAALLVLLFHATFMSQTYLDYRPLDGVFRFGYSGVDFFFVLSGFIIFWAHHGELGHPTALRPYVRRRFVRIYPLYWIVAILLTPIYFGLPHRFHDWVVLAKSF